MMHIRTGFEAGAAIIDATGTACAPEPSPARLPRIKRCHTAAVLAPTLWAAAPYV